MLTLSNSNVSIIVVMKMKAKIIATTSERLVEAMRKKNLTQAELSRRTGIDKSSICLYIKGNYSPKGDKLYKLSLALDVSPAWLSGFNVPMTDNEKSSPGAEEKTPRERKYDEIISLLQALPEEKVTEAIRYLKYLADN
jgi:transcriptional regulator with XRE-family HTH domain